MVKFRQTYDPENMGMQEYHYNEVAKRCGIDVPDFKLIDGKYFATRRFDRSLNNERYHVATAGALLCISLSNPVLDYSNLLALTGYLTKERSAVEEMFRRMVFNYLTDNKDDHCKNFSYLCKKDKQDNYVWTLAPAYDLPLCTEGYNGEHATSINGKGSPTLEDILTVGMKIKLTKKQCVTLFEEVRDEVGDLLLHEIRTI